MISFVICIGQVEASTSPPGILIFFIYQRSNLLNLPLPEPESRSKAPSQIHDQTRTQMLKA